MLGFKLIHVSKRDPGSPPIKAVPTFVQMAYNNISSRGLGQMPTPNNNPAT